MKSKYFLRSVKMTKQKAVIPWRSTITEVPQVSAHTNDNGGVIVAWQKVVNEIPAETMTQAVASITQEESPVVVVLCAEGPQTVQEVVPSLSSTVTEEIRAPVSDYGELS